MEADLQNFVQRDHVGVVPPGRAQMCWSNTNTHQAAIAHCDSVKVVGHPCTRKLVVRPLKENGFVVDGSRSRAARNVCQGVDVVANCEPLLFHSPCWFSLCDRHLHHLWPRAGAGVVGLGLRCEGWLRQSYRGHEIDQTGRSVLAFPDTVSPKSWCRG